MYIYFCISLRKYRLYICTKESYRIKNVYFINIFILKNCKLIIFNSFIQIIWKNLYWKIKFPFIWNFDNYS